MGSKEEVLQAISDPMKMLRYTSERYDSLKGFPRGKISIALVRLEERSDVMEKSRVLRPVALEKFRTLNQHKRRK